MKNVFALLALNLDVSLPWGNHSASVLGMVGVSNLKATVLSDNTLAIAASSRQRHFLVFGSLGHLKLCLHSELGVFLTWILHHLQLK